MKQKKTMKSIVSFCISLALLMQIIQPAIVNGAEESTIISEAVKGTQGVTYTNTAEANSLYDGSIDIENITDEQIVDEIDYMREEYTKYFRLTDGTILAASYKKPVHVLNSDGAWEDVDYRMMDQGSEYENASGSFRVQFSKNPKNGKLYTLKTDEGQIKWSLSGVGESKKEAALVKDADKKEKLAVHNTSGYITYEDILPGVSLQYLVSENELKENIIFADATSATPLEFQLQTNKFNVSLENNTIYFSSQSGEKIYAMSAPWMMDSNGAISNQVTLGLSGSKNHYTVTITPDMQWLKTASYPVTVDPIIQKILVDTPNVTVIDSTYVISARPDSAECYEYGSIRIGRESSEYNNIRAALKFELPASVTSSDRVIAASLQLTHRSTEPALASTAVTVNVHRITQNLDISTLTWNKLNGKYDTKVTDSQVLTTASSSTWTKVPFDITTLVRDWYQNGGNYGVALVSENENSTYKYVAFHTDHNTAVSAENYPTLIIQFANNNGIEDNITYHTAGNSEMGMVYVNDFNGNLVYIVDDVATNGNLFPASVSHVFDNTYRNMSRPYNDSAYMGTGFRLNIEERIVTCDISGYPYKYLDADGTWHYFKVKDEENNLYVDEFNPQRVLKRNNNADGTPKNFVLSDGSDIETMFTWNGYVTYKQNVSNSKIADVHFIGNTADVDKITDGAGKVIDLTYNSNRYLTGITDPAGRTTTYTYTNNRLTRITRPGGRTVALSYDGNGCLTKITSHDGSSIVITYYASTYNGTDSLRRVHTLTEKGTDGTEGRKLIFTYGTGETTVTDRSGKSETLMFDDFGQTVSVRDNEGRGTFLKYNSPDVMKDINPGLTDNTESQKSKATLLSYSTNMQSTISNAISNGDFEDGTLGLWTFENSIYSGTGSAELSTEQAYEGNKSLKIVSTSLTRRYGYQQNISALNLAAGETYTLSSYVKITDITVSPGTSISGAVMYFGYMLEDGTWDLSCGPAVQVTNEWVRIYKTFSVPENAVYLYAKIGLYGCIGTAYFDNVQVEAGSVVSSYNMIDNGNFKDAVGTAIPSAYVGANLLSGTDMVVTEDGRRCFKITGERQKNKNIEQVIQVSGGAGDKYSFSAWAKSTGALSKLGSLTSGHRNFDVRITFVRTDGTWDSRYYAFESKTTGWQFLAGEVIANCDYKSVRMAIIYNNQKNTAFVDDFCLFNEGSNVRYTYDDWGRVTKITDEEEQITKYTYVIPYSSDTSVIPDSRVASVTYPDNTTETYTYDSHKRLLTHKDADNVLSTYHYDSYGNLLNISVTNTESDDSLVLAGTVTGYLTNGDYAASVTDPYGNTVTYETDVAKGLVESITDAKGTVTEYTYNADTDALTRVEVLDSKVDYGYTNHRLTSILHYVNSEENVTYGFTYDVFGNTDTISVGNRLLIDQTYAPYNGNLIRTTYGNGFYTENIYDELDRVTGVKYNGVTKYTWEYDYKGRVGLSSDLQNGQEYRYVYDSSDRLVQIYSRQLSAGLPTIDFRNTYNREGQLAEVVRQIGLQLLRTQYIYTDSGRLEKEIFTGESNVNYTYDLLGRVSQKVLSDSEGADILRYGYTFRPGQEENTTTAQILSETISGSDWTSIYGYTYDENGNITEVTKDGTVYAGYSYDGLSQLTTATIGNNTYSYIYDNGGNILSKTEDGVTKTYIYGDASWKDLLTSYDGQAITYDAIGNPLTYRDGMNFTWEGRRMSGASVGENTLSFSYNADGIRTKKTVNGVTTYYVVDGNKIISQQTGDMKLYFEYDASGNVATILYGEDTYYYIRNILGDIVGLSDENGVQVVSYEYDPWGKILSITDNSETGIGTLNPIRYKGYYYDSETGFYYLNSRYYDSEIGRFINADVYVSTGQGILGCNMYAYCNNNSVIYVDYTGQVMENVLKNQIGSGYGVTVGYDFLGLLMLYSTLDMLESASEAIEEAATTAVEAVSNKIEEINSKTYSVYFLQDATGTVRYVGRVTDYGYDARMSHHKRTRGLYPKYRIPGLSKEVARGLEEMGMIEYHTLNALNPVNNQIHGISWSNGNGDYYMQAALDYLLNRAEEKVLNIFNVFN